MTTTMFETKLSPQRPLVALDRCDKCGAEALVRATLRTGGELLFCGHHFRVHKDVLRPMCTFVHVETNRYRINGPV